MATGGADGASLSLTPDKRESLTCAMCLEIFRDPKLLSCSHTFCMKCLEDLVKRHTDGSFPCPSCRKNIEIPKGGVADLQANFYIDADELERARDEIHCNSHPQKQLNMFCVECEVLLCMDCKLADHLHHKSQSLVDAAETAGDQLTNDKTRLKAAITELEKNVKDREKNITEMRVKKTVVEREIHQRHSTIVAAADKYRDEALAAVETACTDIDNTESKELIDIKNNVEGIRKLCEKIDKAQTKGEECKIVTIAKEMKSGYGREVVKTMSHPCLANISRPVHRSVVPENDMMFDTMKKFIGSCECIEIGYTEAKVRAAEKFRCNDDNDVTAFCVFSMDSESVYMSFDPSYSQQMPPMRKYSHSGQFIDEVTSQNDQIAVGKESMQEQKHSLLFYGQDYINFAKSKRSGLLYSLCSRDGEKSRVRTETDQPGERTEQFSLVCGHHRGFDVDSSEKLFVVVSETEHPKVHREVRLYKKPVFKKAIAIAADMYRSPLISFQPADVCFFILQGQEVHMMQN